MIWGGMSGPVHSGRWMVRGWMSAVAKELNHIAGNVMHQIQMVLRIHLKTHSGKKSNKCNQCDYSSPETDNLKIHLEMHSEFKSILDRITCSD